MSREEDGFLSRWSRRKLESRREVEPAPEPAPLAPEPPPEAGEPVPEVPGEGEMSAEEIAALPPVESIGPQTDISAFLRKGVPAALRKAALRRVWAADPAIRDYVNEAREYAYDWNVPGGVPGTGALLPTDDVEAMLARVFGGSPAPGPRPGVTEEPPPSDAVHAQAPRDGTLAQGREVADPAQDPLPQEAADQPAKPPRSAERETISPEKDAESPRPRRHGGAVPV